MENTHIKRITKENCKTKHDEMLEMGMYYCPVCEEPIKEQKPILITITKQAEILYKEVV